MEICTCGHHVDRHEAWGCTADECGCAELQRACGGDGCPKPVGYPGALFCGESCSGGAEIAPPLCVCGHAVYNHAGAASSVAFPCGARHGAVDWCECADYECAGGEHVAQRARSHAG